MATETFFKKIIISKEAAEIMAAEAEKEREPYTPKFDFNKEMEESRKWLDERRLRKLSEQKTK